MQDRAPGTSYEPTLFDPSGINQNVAEPHGTFELGGSLPPNSSKPTDLNPREGFRGPQVCLTIGRVPVC